MVISQCNSKTNSSVCVHVYPGYLEWVKTGDDAAVLHVAGARGVSELAFGVRTRAGSSLELSAHLQRQPLGVSTHGHIDGHGGPSVSGGLGWGSQAWWSTKAAKNVAALQKLQKMWQWQGDPQTTSLEMKTQLSYGQEGGIVCWSASEEVWREYEISLKSGRESNESSVLRWSRSMWHAAVHLRLPSRKTRH